jgi:hypothetical protein
MSTLLQTVLVEFLIRLGSSGNVFGDEESELARGFREISAKNFEPDSRKFLNLLNQLCGEDAKVWTVGCLRAEVGNFDQLKCERVLV